MEGSPEAWKIISKLYFVVNPGWISDPDNYEEKYCSDSNMEKSVARGENLLRLYVEKAKTLGEDEMMFIFAHTKGVFFREDVKINKEYIKAAREIREALGDRLVVLACGENFEDDRTTLMKAMDIAEARGYCIDKDIDTEAWGETGEHVSESAWFLNYYGYFGEKTVVNYKMTDLHEHSPEDIREFTRDDFAEADPSYLDHIVFDYGDSNEGATEDLEIPDNWKECHLKDFSPRDKELIEALLVHKLGSVIAYQDYIIIRNESDEFPTTYTEIFEAINSGFPEVTMRFIVSHNRV